ncbi:hypothetical protein NEQG_00879 [Nematocida parisii ERTm3]|uniref:Choline kinase n=2 Tax=Nematocida parisii TaxID=586133 RepID=I3EIL3_NEMP3|nr:hypothetical protein NEQG_00879 [Nematocida parisii ERTm3]
MEDNVKRSQGRVLKGKASKAKMAASKFLKCDPSELVAEKEKAGYSNIVYKIIKGKDKYLYKEYLAKTKESMELRWQRFFKSPKILFECEYYHIDEYIDHVPLTKELIKNKEIIQNLARAVAEIHSAENVPECREMNIFYLNAMKRERNNLNSRIRFIRFAQICKKIEKKIECHYSESMFSKDMCICHNDLQFGNILVLPHMKTKIIDFEHVSINIPTVDIANLFNEACTNYNARGAPLLKKQHFIKTNNAKIFVKEYLDHRGINIPTEKVLQEIEKMQTISHYYWFIWATDMILKNKTKSGLDYMTFAKYRLQYLEKDNFITKNNIKELISFITNSL